MKDLTKIYIDLSECTEEEQKHIFSLLPPTKTNSLEIFEESVYLHYIEYWGKWVVDDILSIYKKTKLTYPEFIKLFEGGDEEKEIENIKDIAHTEGVLVGLKICKELWAQGTISHETIQEEIYYYQQELDNLNSK